MSLNYQKEFTQIEAIAIVDMIAGLANDDYEVCISLGGREGDGEDAYYPYSVEIIDTDDTIAATGKAYQLVDALSAAYIDTPEGKSR